MLFQKVLFLDTSKAPFHQVFVVKSIGHKQHRIKGDSLTLPRFNTLWHFTSNIAENLFF